MMVETQLRGGIATQKDEVFVFGGVCCVDTHVPRSVTGLLKSLWWRKKAFAFKSSVNVAAYCMYRNWDLDTLAMRSTPAAKISSQTCATRALVALNVETSDAIRLE